MSNSRSTALQQQTKRLRRGPCDALSGRPRRALFCLLLCLGLCLSLCIPARAALPVRSAILVNLNTGRVLYEQSADTAIPPASLTKLMSMFLTLDAVKAGRISLNR